VTEPLESSTGEEGEHWSSLILTQSPEPSCLLFRHLKYIHISSRTVREAMAGNNNNQFNPAFLTQNQQGLLLAALASNQADQHKNGQLLNPQDLDFSADTMDPSLFLSSQADSSLGTFDMTSLDDQQFLDYLDSNRDSVDYDLDQADGFVDDSVDPNSFEGGDGDLHDKRKSIEDDDGDEDGLEPKRREGEEKTAKKPGRKPLTSEPTTKRKAQNRAAQRAFRERKEKHLKDLETKVAELEKVSETTNQENGILKAQVERLQTELKEYRKRLSLNSTIGRSPPLLALQSYPPNGPSAAANTFHFEFPKFGSIPAGPLFDNGTSPASITPPVTSSSSNNSVQGVLARLDSTDGQISPASNARASISSNASPSNHGSFSNGIRNRTSASPAFTESYGSILTTPTLNPLGHGSPGGYNMFTSNTSAEPLSMASTDNPTPQSRIFQFNSNSNSSASPSASSVSQYGNGTNSSCGTSPEPSHNSPATGSKDITLSTINEQGYPGGTTTEGEINFCARLSMACGNTRDPQPPALSKSNGSSAPTAENIAATATAGVDQSTSLNGMDYFVNENGGQFDPILFGDYRDNNAAIIGDGDFTGGFFNDAMPNFDFATPFNWNDLTGSNRTGLTPAVPKPNPLEQADVLTSADYENEEVVPGDDMSKLMSCHNIWDKLQERKDFQDGNLDIDGLCDELRAKAKCSESGVVIDQKDVDAALERLPAARS
jgi:AP-1-like factor